jgi:hypothetical protein
MMRAIDLTVQCLYERRHQAATIPFEAGTMESGPPTEHECHNNTDRWVREHQDHKSVRGWLVIDYNEATQGLFNNCKFIAHSVVEAPDGRLFDLTPSQASQRYPFLRHDGPEKEFVAFVQAGHTHLEGVVTPSGELLLI